MDSAYRSELADIPLEQKRSLLSVLSTILASSDEPKPALSELHHWLNAKVEVEAAINPMAIPPKPGREVVSQRQSGSTTYQLEQVKCGKKGCKCTTGKLHGPYWYAYHWNGKKVVSQYVGKVLPSTQATGEVNTGHRNSSEC